MVKTPEGSQKADVLTFHSSAVVTVTISFDVYKHGHSPIKLYGTEGSLKVPDPNTFGGPVGVVGGWRPIFPG